MALSARLQDAAPEEQRTRYVGFASVAVQRVCLNFLSSLPY